MRTILSYLFSAFITVTILCATLIQVPEPWRTYATNVTTAVIWASILVMFMLAFVRTKDRDDVARGMRLNTHYCYIANTVELFAFVATGMWFFAGVQFVSMTVVHSLLQRRDHLLEEQEEAMRATSGLVVLERD